VLKYHMPDMDEAKLKDIFKEIDQVQVWLRDGTEGGATVTGEGEVGGFALSRHLRGGSFGYYCLLGASLHSRRTAWYR
jgi:hypothetical protein